MTVNIKKIIDTRLNTDTNNIHCLRNIDINNMEGCFPLLLIGLKYLLFLCVLKMKSICDRWENVLTLSGFGYYSIELCSITVY